MKRLPKKKKKKREKEEEENRDFKTSRKGAMVLAASVGMNEMKLNEWNVRIFNMLK